MSKMSPLLKTVLLRTLGFLLFGFLSPLLFTIVEHTAKDDRKEKYQLLISLYESMASKYNMSIEEFNNFSSVAHEALSEPKPQWDYFVAMEFVFQAITTIGKVTYGRVLSRTDLKYLSKIVNEWAVITGQNVLLLVIYKNKTSTLSSLETRNVFLGPVQTWCPSPYPAIKWTSFRHAFALD